MTNRGLTTAEQLHSTIRANKAAKQPAATCPLCGSKTRQGVRCGSVLDLCTNRACSWDGKVHLPELQASVKAEMGSLAQAEMGIGGVA